MRAPTKGLDHMKRRQGDRRAVYAIAAANSIVVLILATLLLKKPEDARVLAPACFVTLLLANFLYLRVKMGTVDRSSIKESSMKLSHAFSSYALSIVFFVGTLYGAIMICQGQLPRAILPLLLVPLSVAILCLRTACRVPPSRPE